MMTRLPLLIALLTGCESLEDRARYLTGPDAIVWKSDSKFTVSGQDDMKGSINFSEGVLTVYLSGFPPGTQATLGSQTAAVRDIGAAQVETEMTAFFGSVSTQDWLRGMVEGASLQLQAPGKEVFSIPLPAQQALLLDQHLATVVEAPLLYVGEQATAVSPPATIFWHYGATNELLGVQAATLGGIDAIAIVKEVEVGTRTCPGYEAGDGSTRDLTLKLTDHVVTVYDRRTGSSLAEQSFPPIDQCPGSTFSFSGQAFETQTVLPDAEIRTWLEGLVAS